MSILNVESLLILIIAFIAIVFGIRFYYSKSTKSKIEGYKSEIAKSNSRILKLEVRNEKLNNRIKELEEIHCDSTTATNVFQN
ncbi:MAG: hypothetical protein MUE72_02780 [Chitinophagaceae bacterium]|jgi:cell division protein FtsL|nr:hypothetical protein [Chitinophagaceae bacterium]